MELQTKKIISLDQLIKDPLDIPSLNFESYELDSLTIMCEAGIATCELIESSMEYDIDRITIEAKAILATESNELVLSNATRSNAESISNPKARTIMEKIKEFIGRVLAFIVSIYNRVAAAVISFMNGAAIKQMINKIQTGDTSEEVQQTVDQMKLVMNFNSIGSAVVYTHYRLRSFISMEIAKSGSMPDTQSIRFCLYRDIGPAVYKLLKSSLIYIEDMSAVLSRSAYGLQSDFCNSFIKLVNAVKNADIELIMQLFDMSYTLDVPEADLVYASESQTISFEMGELRDMPTLQLIREVPAHIDMIKKKYTDIQKCIKLYNANAAHFSREFYNTSDPAKKLTLYSCMQDCQRNVKALQELSQVYLSATANILARKQGAIAV